jgi:membrane dipeptidase
MLEAVEREAARWPERVGVARSLADVERLRAAGRIALVHTVEGAHVLGGRLERLDALAERGVAMLTLAHFYGTDIVTPVDSVPKNLFLRRLCSFRFPTGQRPPLTELGRELLHRMAALRIIPDVTHCSPEARREVYRAVGRRRPVVASHVGVAALFPDPYNLSDEDLREIAATGGAAGVILMPYWLTGNGIRDAVPAIWRTMEHVREVTGSWDHVMLGSDFDGFSLPPRDVRDASRLGLVTGAMLERGVAPADVKKVLGGNAMRILYDGWR